MPIEEKHLADLSNHYHIEMLYLLAVRCKTNLSFAAQQVKQHYPTKIVTAFTQQISLLAQRASLKFEYYSELMKDYENKFASILKDRFIKLTKKKTFQEREKFLNGLECLDFTKE